MARPKKITSEDEEGSSKAAAPPATPQRTARKNAKEAPLVVNAVKEDTPVSQEIYKERALQLFEEVDETPLWLAIWTLACYAVLIVFGHIRDFMRKYGLEKNIIPGEKANMKDFVPLYKDFEAFYKRNLYRRMRDCWNRPICSVPGAYFRLKERDSHDTYWTFSFTGQNDRSYLNLGSYNYLGFGQNNGPVTDTVLQSIQEYGVTTNSPAAEFGTTTLIKETEAMVAKFVGKEDAVVFGMGFATNSTNIPIFAGKGCLIISDELNHASLVLGARLAGATIQIYKHNDMAHLEKLLRTAVVGGQPRSHRPWKKILICVEGIYSMEGSLVNLPVVVELKKKYKAYLYLDEAHSIGALGKSGRGICEFLNIDVNDIDVLMGTFTKSFGAAGGYIAGSHELIAALRDRSHSHYYGISMSPAVCQQIISSLRVISGLDGTDDGQRRICQLAANAKYFRQHMKRMGFIVYGNDASPIVPMLIFLPARLCTFSRMCKARGLAVVVVGSPATTITTGRARFCLSAAHSQEDMNLALSMISEVGDQMGLKYKGGKPFDKESIKFESDF